MKHNTLRNYKCLLKRIANILKGNNQASITKENIVDGLQEWVKKKEKSPRKKSWDVNLKMIKCFYQTTYNYKLECNTFKGTIASIPKEIVSNQKFIEELKRMKGVEEFFEEFIYLSLLFLTGARSVDIRGLTFKDIGMENNINYVYFDEQKTSRVGVSKIYPKLY